MGKRATDDVLGLIHTLTAEKLLKRLESDDPLSPAEINAISKFLKDNEITATVEPGTPHESLARAFGEFDAETVGLFNRTAAEG